MQTIFIIGAFIIAFILVVISIPPIVRVTRVKHLFEVIDSRKIHTEKIPTLGGVAIFIGFILSSIVATDGLSFDSLKYIIVAVILIFFIGLKDDLMVISVRKKLMVQIFAAIILIAPGNIYFSDLHGILGVYEIHPIISVPLTLFIIIVIINAFNLIDGIDGLASGLGILSGTFFGIWFYLTGHLQLSIMAFALVGSLSAFFIFNVFGKKNKLFMGDTGSMIIGIVISTLVICFNEFNIINTSPFTIRNAPAVSFAVIAVPLIDTLRVMSIRIIQKRSPFSPDNNHIHHRLLALIHNHFKVTMIIVVANAAIILFALMLNGTSININFQFLLIVVISIALSFIPVIILKMKSSKQVEIETA